MVGMQDVLNALKAAIETANRAAVEYDTAKNKVNSIGNDQVKLAEVLAKREAEIKKVEAILGPALNLKILQDNAIKAKADAEAAMRELKIRSEAFADYSQKEEKRLEEQRRSQDKIAQAQKDKEENIMQREINLERLVIEKVQKLFPHQKIGG